MSRFEASTQSIDLEAQEFDFVAASMQTTGERGIQATTEHVSIEV